MISVKLFPTVAARSQSKQRDLTLPFRNGITAGDVLKQEGFPDDYIRYLVVMINGQQAKLETPLNDGDVLDIMVALAGGAGKGQALDAAWEMAGC